MSTAHLDRLQRWMQAVITDPDGVVHGAEAGEARGHLEAEIGDLIAPSDSLPAESRIGIYSSMYFDRLLEILEEDFPAVRDAAGEVEFRSLLRDYLVAHPSEHYSLNMLGERFPAFVEGRAGELRNGDFLTELARLERAVQEVFDAPAVDPLDAQALESVSQDAWVTARIEAVPALRLFAFEHDTNAWYQAFREERRRPAVEREPSWLVLYRREHRVWRLGVSREQHALLSALVNGVALAQALEATAALPGVDVQALSGSLGEWFRDWTGLGFFAAIRPAEEA